MRQRAQARGTGTRVTGNARDAGSGRRKVQGEGTVGRRGRSIERRGHGVDGTATGDGTKNENLKQENGKGSNPPLNCAVAAV